MLYTWNKSDRNIIFLSHNFHGWLLGPLIISATYQSPILYTGVAAGIIPPLGYTRG